MNIHGEPFEGLPLEVDKEHALGRTHIQPLVDGQQGRYILVDAQLVGAQGQHSAAVVTAKAIVGAEPDVAVLVLHNIAHCIGSQPVVHGDKTVAVVILRSGSEERQDSDDDA